MSYFGYMSFGANVASNILNSYPVNAFTTLGRFGVAIVVITSYPIQTFATRKSFANILRTLGGGEPPKTPPSTFINDKLELMTMIVLLIFTFSVALVRARFPLPTPPHFPGAPRLHLLHRIGSPSKLHGAP